MRKSAPKKPPYVPTEVEKSLMDEWLKRDGPKRPRVTISINDHGVFDMGVKHPEPVLGELLIMRALGLNSTGELGMFKRQMFGMCRVGDPPNPKAVETEMNNIIDVVVAQAPKGITEAMLCLQMAGVHIAISRAMQTVMNTDYPEQRAQASDAVNKLSRTFTMQVDALKRHRSKGREQRVVVEHKHYNYVAPGAQAVFVEGDKAAGGGGVDGKSSPQSHGREVAQIPQGAERPMRLVDLALTDEKAA